MVNKDTFFFVKILLFLFFKYFHIEAHMVAA